MVNTNPPNHDEGGDQRAAMRRRVLAEVTAARLAGEDRSDDAVIAAHPELQPELAADLAELRTVETARRAAFRSSGSSDDAQWRPTAGSRIEIPGYENLEEVHRGAQGTVYQARQLSTGRSVAVKVMHEGPFSRERQRMRFQREIEILAGVKHPNIVRVHDGGVAQDRFYCVMDYVEGQTLDAYVLDCAHSVSERLQLLAKICDGVHAAHLRGIIHRDIKPANIRIGPNGEPHLLDFGLAKRLPLGVEDGGSASAATATGQFVGSLSWASPEQLAADPEQVDVRSDVYALGVVMHQVLTGRLPYPVSGGIREAVESITNAEPSRPSSLCPEVDGEVDAIVLRALQKEPAHRFQSAGDLARDIRNYLGGEPVEARKLLPHASWYMFAKTMRRHRVVAVFSLVLILTVVVFTVTLARLYRESQANAEAARIETGRAEEALIKADTARQEAERNARTALREAARAATVDEFLNSMLASVQPERAADSNQDVTVRELLDSAAANVAAQLDGQPEAEAVVRHTIGASYLSLGRHEEAAAQLRASAEIRMGLYDGPMDETADSLALLGSALRYQGNLAESEEVLRDTLAIRRALSDTPAGESELGATLLALARTQHARGQYSQARETIDEALEVTGRTNGERSLEYALALYVSAWLKKDMHDFAGAEAEYRTAIDIHDELDSGQEKGRSDAINNLGLLLQQRGRLAEAEPLLREALAYRREFFGDRHPETALTMNNLGMLLNAQGDVDGAEAIFTEVLAMCREFYGNDHPWVSASLNNLSRVSSKRGDADGAVAYQREALAINRRIFGEDHPQAGFNLRNLALLLEDEGDFDEAETLFRETLAIQRSSFGDSNPRVAGAALNLANLLGQLGRHDEAETLLREAVTIRRPYAEKQPAELIAALTLLGKIQVKRGDVAAARASFAEALSLQMSLDAEDSNVQRLEELIQSLS